MIRTKLNIILFIWPIVLLLGMWLHGSYQRYQIDKKLMEADGLVWKAGEKQFVVRVNRREEGELLHIEIRVLNPEKQDIYKKTEVIDRDMFGGGFVRAVQVDQDPENEIVVWHARARYFLDFSDGNVTEVSFDQVPQPVKILAQAWHKFNIMASLEMTFIFIFSLCYYLLCFIVIGFLRLIKRK